MPLSTLAYSNDLYEIELPSTFMENAVLHQFNDANGNNINFQFYTVKDASEFQYSDEFLTIITNQLKDLIDSYIVKNKSIFKMLLFLLFICYCYYVFYVAILYFYFTFITLSFSIASAILIFCGQTASQL